VVSEGFAFGTRIQAVVDQNEKLIVSAHLKGAPAALYDLRSDPRELTNLAAERPDDVSRLKGVLKEVLPSAVKAHPLDSAGSSDAETRARLEALGYLDPSE
jgi:arylsulfatase A-like enzyme